MVESIKDPDALAEAACSAELLTPGVKDVIVLHGCFADTQAKTRSLLQIIEGKVKGQPNVFHQFLAILRTLPALSQLALHVQASYGKCVLLLHSEFIAPNGHRCTCDGNTIIKRSATKY